MIPTVQDCASDPLTHQFGDMFNLPGLTNFLGCVQADLDITGIRSLNFPPFATSDTLTGSLYVDGTFFKATAAPITFVWYPDRIERTAETGGIRFHSVTVLAVAQMAVLVRLEMENRSGIARTLTLKVGLRGGVTRVDAPWVTAIPPSEEDNRITVDQARGVLLFSARASQAASCQGIIPVPAEISTKSMTLRVTLAPGQKSTITYINAIGGSVEEAAACYQRVASAPERAIAGARENWNQELAAVFTPGNGRYSGSLPVLETIDGDIARIYHMGVLGVISFKRDTPFSVIGRAYDTLIPKWWQTVTFIWDYSLSSLVHALLDPDVMRKYLHHWMKSDIHTHFGTEYLTGGPVGPWYSANDFSMVGLAREYLRWTGNHEWLKEQVAGRSVLDYLTDYATNWKHFRQPGGLADYGGLLNLLECVSTYVHQVASLNAGNVFSLRTVAELHELMGNGSLAKELRQEAGELLKNILPLYRAGKGSWSARFPDGSLVDVRHCYDFFTVMNTIGGDLSVQQREEMVEFFRRELQTPTWMRALSADDDDAMFSVRPDHQWNGAYPAWPPQALLALYRAGRADVAFQWMKGLARSANQGPFGQAHFVDPIIPPDSGGARKAPIEFPFITDWTVSSGGSWVSAVIEGLFGVRAPIRGMLEATPAFSTFDPGAELHNLHYQGEYYHVSRTGVHPAK
jgi:hypothetical protein